MSNRRRVIDRKKRDLAATKRSQRQVSELALNEDEESHLIDLLAQLEGVNLKTAAEIEAIHIANNPKNETQSKKKQKDESSSGSEGSSDEDEDGSSSSESDEETEEDVETVEIKELTTNELNLMTREKYMRRLIRTDRFERKLLRLGEVKSAESIAAKIRKTITTPSKSTTILPTPPTGGMKGTVSRKVEGVLPPQAVSATKATSLLGPTVRVSVDIVKDKLRGKPKLLVFSRTIDMSDMLSQIRGKFNNAGNKFNALCMVPPSLNGKYKEKDLDSFKILDELDMMMLEDDTQLVLVAVDKKKLSYIPKELKDHQLPKAHEAMQKLSTPEVDESGAKAGQEEEKASGETPDAVKKEETAKWSEDWSPPDDPENQYVYTPLVANASRSNEIKYTLYQTQQLIHSSKSNIRRDPNKVQDGGERDEGDDDELYTANIKAQRESLPIYAKRDEILQALRDHQVMIVCGETGSGKTTQVAQYVLEEMIHNQLGAQCNIICTEPRRIAAVSVAQRVHEEVYHSYNMYGWNVENSMSSSQTSATSSSSSLVSEASQSSASVKGDESLPVIQPNRHGSYKPELGKGLVGYSVRLDSRASEETRLLYCTTGVLLRKLQSETYLKSVSHIIIDEVHERGVETDFLMTILKQQLANFPHLRIILMSATMQEEKFQAYFNQCPCVYVSGRTFPVTVNYMETIRPLITKAGNNHRPIATKPSNGKFVQSNSKNQDIDENAVPPIFDAEIVADVVSHIIAITSNTNRVIPGAVPTTGVDISVRGEAILVFLSGIHAIEKVQKALRNRTNLRGANIKIHILHSTVPPEQQRRVFKPTSPGEWKIVLATNIAETSITVDDITHVVDSGFMKEQRYNPATGINTLQEVFISRSNGKQRAGRAGRVKPGTCWRLFGEAYYTNGASKLAAAKAASTVSVSTPSTSSSNKGAAVQVSKPVNLPPEAIVQEYSIPEIQRIALEEVILQVLYLRLGRPESFLTQCLSPPSLQQIKAAIACLIEIKAIYPKAGYPLTALGYHLAKMPVDVRIGKMLIYSSLLECVEPVLTIAAYLSSKTPFQAPIDKREDARKKHAKFLHYKEYLAPHKKMKPRHKDEDSDEVSDDDSDVSEGDEELIENCRSDHMAVIHAYDCWKKVYRKEGVQAARNFAREYYLSFNTLSDIDSLRDYYREYLLSTGFIPKDHMKQQRDVAKAIENMEDEIDTSKPTAMVLDINQHVMPQKKPHKAKKQHKRYEDVLVHDNEYSIHRDLTRCAMCAGFFPNVVRAIRVSVNGKVDSIKLLQADNQAVNLHPSSLLMQNRSAIIPQECQDAFLVYYRKNEGDGNINVFDVSMIPHAVLLLFAGNEIVMSNPGKKKNARKSSRIMLNGWIEMELSELHLACYRRIQREIESVLRQKVEYQQCDLLDRQAMIQSVLMILLAHDD